MKRSIASHFAETFAPFLEQPWENMQPRDGSRAERIAERLTDAASDVHLFAGQHSEYHFRRYEFALRRVALLTYALQHP